MIFKGIDRKLIEVLYFYYIGNYYYLLIVEGGIWFEYAVIIVCFVNIEGLYEVYFDNLILMLWYDLGNLL